jgi:hypothetical protein
MVSKIFQYITGTCKCFNRGKEGTKATVRVLRGGKQMDFATLRRPIKLKSVVSSKAEVNGKEIGNILPSVVVLTLKSDSQGCFMTGL